MVGSQIGRIFKSISENYHIKSGSLMGWDGHFIANLRGEEHFGHRPYAVCYLN